MNPSHRQILLIASDVSFSQGLLDEFLRRSLDVPMPIAATLAQARAHLRRLSPALIVLDQSAAGARPMDPAVREFVLAAPVLVLVDHGRSREVGRLQDLLLVAKVEVVWRGPDAISLTCAAIERRLGVGSGTPLAPPRPVGAAPRLESEIDFDDVPEDFGEILRHEVNNPLTGILGNAELLLARRDALPPTAVQRLETIAELAVRLRETVRRLSNSWEARAHHLRSA